MITQRGPSVLASVKATSGRRVMPSDTGAVDWRDAEVVNVRERGIMGDDSDETTKIQTLLTNMKAASPKARRLFFPEPTATEYKITDKLTVDMGRLRIEGAHRDRIIIKQYTANTPILYWSSAFAGNVHTVHIADLSLRHNAAAGVGNTQQYGIQVRPNADGSLADGNGFYLWNIERVRFDYCYVGIGSYTIGSGTGGFWSTVFRDLVFWNTQQHAFKLYDAGVIGRPHNTIEHVDVLNYDASVASDGAVIKSTGGTGLVINHLNVEDWHNQILDIEGGTYTVINGLRTERHDLIANATNVLYLANGQFVLNGVDLSGLRIQHGTTNGNTVKLIKADQGASVVVNGIKASKAAAGYTPTAGKVAMLAGSPSTVAWIYADGVADDPANNVLGIQPSTVNGELYGIVRYNGMPPVWDAAPVASVTYRGRSYRTEGGAGVADVEYRCLKDAANAYAWKAAVTG